MKFARSPCCARAASGQATATPPSSDAEGVRSNAGVPPEVYVRELKRLHNFLDGDWGDPKDHPLRYPRGRNGW